MTTKTEEQEELDQAIKEWVIEDIMSGEMDEDFEPVKTIDDLVALEEAGYKPVLRWLLRKPDHCLTLCTSGEALKNIELAAERKGRKT